MTHLAFYLESVRRIVAYLLNLSLKCTNLNDFGISIKYLKIDATDMLASGLIYSSERRLRTHTHQETYATTILV